MEYEAPSHTALMCREDREENEDEYATVQEYVSLDEWTTIFRDTIENDFYLVDRVASLESQIAEQNEQAGKLATDIIDSIVDLTTNLFGEDVRIYASHDPEFPESRYTVLAVQSSRPLAELMQLELEWVRGVSRISPGFDTFRLKLTPVYESK